MLSGGAYLSMIWWGVFTIWVLKKSGCNFAEDPCAVTPNRGSGRSGSIVRTVVDSCDP